MGLSHCPLCQALAVLCLVRYGAYAWLLWNLVSEVRVQATAPTTASASSTLSAVPLLDGPRPPLLPALPSS
jgi:hypothetical protein